MNATDKQRLKDAFNEWAKNHPEPDAPCMAIGSNMLSAKGWAEALTNETPAGKDLLEILEHGVNREGIDKVVERFTRRPPQP